MSSLAMTVSAEDPGWKKGDSWTYSWHATEENLSISGSVVMKVAGTQQVNVAGVMKDAFLVEVKGDGTASGIFDAVSVTATVTLNGSETRLQSDLSLVKTGFNMEMVMQLLGMTVTMSVGMSATMTPPQEDLPIDVNLTAGAKIHSAGTITGTTWMAFMGTNESTPVSETFNLDLSVKQVNVDVTVPKGTFQCAFIEISSDSTVDGTFYYSPKVGNYVKSSSESNSLGAISLGQLELTAYKHGGSSASTMMLIIGIVAAIVVVAVVLAVVMMRRPKAPATMMPPQGQAMPPSPPLQGPPQPPPGA